MKSKGHAPSSNAATTASSGWRQIPGVLVLLAIAGMACAQNSLKSFPPLPEAVATPTELTSPAFVLEARAVADIQRDLDDARTAGQNAETTQQQMLQAETQGKGELDVKKTELETLKARIDLARKQKLDVERASFERQRQGDELNLTLTALRITVTESKAELARAEKDLAVSRVRVHENELELAKRQAAWKDLSGPAATTTSAQGIVNLESDIHSLERRTLQAMSELTGKQEEVAKRQRDVIEKQLGVLDAQNAIVEYVNRAR